MTAVPGADAALRSGFALWQDATGDGFDRCAMLPTVLGTRLSGTASLPWLGRGATARYILLVDHAWRVLDLDLRVSTSGSDERIRLTSEEPGRWTRGGVHMPDLDGCLDVTLDVTPAALTPLARRLALPRGATATVDTVAVAVASLDVRRERVEVELDAQGRWLHRRGGRTAVVAFGPQGLVTECDGRWRAVALG